MKSTALYALLEYQYSQLKDEKVSLATLSYDGDKGNISFEYDKKQIQENLQPYKVKFQIIEAYLEAIQNNIAKNHIQKSWNESQLKKYIDQYILPPDDSALKFAKVKPKPMNTKAKIYYFSLTDEMRKEEKLDWFKNTKLQNIPFELITPDKKNNWINLSDNDFEELIPVCSKDVKAGKGEKAIFKLHSNQVKSNRDEWVYDFDRDSLENKIKFFIKKYQIQLNSNQYKNEDLDYSIKWSRDLKNKLYKKEKLDYKDSNIIISYWRPFIRQLFYSEKILNDVLTDNHYQIFGKNLINNNILINFSDGRSNKPFHALVTEQIADYHFAGDTITIPLYRYTSQGQRIDNITDWSLKLFQGHYQSKQISKEAIFHYVYGVLHNPVYRQKYEQNLKREFPRIPMYADFDFWVAQGKALMGLHLNYEAIEPYPLQRTEKALKSGSLNKAKLKADKEQGIITLDEMTSLLGVPSLAWEYKLGNRSALEWILDQYKEKKPKDPTIREKFNTYQFADYKEEVISLLQKVCAVSVKTIEIIQLMEAKE